jgi:hypothetical protein
VYLFCNEAAIKQRKEGRRKDDEREKTLVQAKPWRAGPVDAPLID